MTAITRNLLTLALAAFAGCAKTSNGVEAAGTIEFTSADLSPAVSAHIIRFYVAEGARVQAGDTIVVLSSTTLPGETRELEAAVAQADAELAEVRRGARPQSIARASAALAEASAVATNAAANAERFKSLAANGHVSAQQYDAAKSDAARTAAIREQAQEALALLRAGATSDAIKIAEARSARARAALSAARAQAGDLVLTAPMSGIVSARYAEEGELATAGRPVATVANPDAPWVRVYVNQSVLPTLRIGQSASARLDGNNVDKFASRIVTINDEAEYTPRIALTEDERADLMFGVKLVLNDSSHALKAGLPITVTFVRPTAAPPTVAQATTARKIK